MKEGTDIVGENLAAVFPEWLRTQKVSKAWKNAVIILIYKKGDAKDPYKCIAIKLLLVYYKVFIKVKVSLIGGIVHSQQARKQAGFTKGTEPCITSML